jgi:serine/threonine protein kinase
MQRRYLNQDKIVKHAFLQLLDAVEYIHSLGIYHRDLTPENVLCFDGGLRLAVADFGLVTTDAFSEEFEIGNAYHTSPGMPTVLSCFPLSEINLLIQNPMADNSPIMARILPCSTMSGPWASSSSTSSLAVTHGSQPPSTIPPSMPTSRTPNVSFPPSCQFPMRSTLCWSAFWMLTGGGVSP